MPFAPSGDALQDAANRRAGTAKTNRALVGKMRKGSEAMGIALGLVAVLWGFLLLPPYGALSAEGDLSFLLVPFVAFAAGAVALVAVVLGRRSEIVGAVLFAGAGASGLAIPAAVIFFNPRFVASFGARLIAYLAVSWWAILLVLLGVIALRGLRNASVASRESPRPPGA